MNDEGSGQLDPARLTAWHAQFASRLKAFAWGLLRDGGLAEEVVQQTFTKAWTHGGDVEEGCEKAWLFQVAYREAMLLRRKAASQDKTYQRVVDDPTIQLRSGSGPDEELLSREAVGRVQQALKKLPVDQQVIVNRRIYQEQTFQQIADDLNLPLGTVLTRMRLAMVKLQKALRSEFF